MERGVEAHEFFDSAAKTGVLRLQILHPSNLIAPQPAVLLTPAIIRHLSEADRIASATDLPCDVSTSTSRSFATISSGL